jgi:hypothetical protein
MLVSGSGARPSEQPQIAGWRNSSLRGFQVVKIDFVTDTIQMWIFSPHLHCKLFWKYPPAELQQNT